MLLPEQALPPFVGPYTDGDLALHFESLAPSDPVKGWVPAYHFGMFVGDEDGPYAGHIQLRTAHTHFLDHYAGQIGYTVEEPHRGKRYAARSVRLLMPLARQLGFTALWITCDPRNAASRRSAALAGAQLVEIVPLPTDCDMYREGDRERCRFRLDL
jgi:tagatose 1,6-diphosphate aldolase